MPLNTCSGSAHVSKYGLDKIKTYLSYQIVELETKEGAYLDDDVTDMNCGAEPPS